jgi:hypothetical protein
MVHFWIKNLLCCLNKIRKILELINPILMGKFTPVPPPRIAQSGPGSPANERQA